MEYLEQYYTPYRELCEIGRQVIYTKDINKSNIDTYFNSIINILKDGIETQEVQNMMITVVFEDGIDVDLSIFDFLINLMMWQLCTSIEKPILSIHLAFFEDITKRGIKEYIDNIFVDKYRKSMKFIDMNQIIDSVIGKFRYLKQFQLFLANTLNLEDTIKLMEMYPEFNETVHFSTDNIPLEEVKDAGMIATNIQIRYIKNSDHCLRDCFRTGEAASPKQYKEVAVNIGSKPDGMGSVFAHPINKSFMNGGLSTPEELCIESSVGRVAQILQKTNVGESGAFARNLEINNQDTYLHEDPDYICDTRNFEKVTITNETKLRMYDLRYYRMNPRGVDKLCNAKRDKHLIGQTVYFRSPMTCASAASGNGICYKCYGDLAFTNTEINIGQIASELLSSIYTQILLSAKHLLESLVIKLSWTDEFKDLFNMQYNTVQFNENIDFKGWKLIIDEELKSEEEIDDIMYNYYISSYIVETPSGGQIRIHTEDYDNIYFAPEFFNYYTKVKSKKNIVEDDGRVEMDFYDIVNANITGLFVMNIRNNELSRTMDQIKKLIDSKGVISQYDRDSILEAFVNTNISGGITLNSVHFEIMLMNQMRAADDELEMPDWTTPNQVYQILTLSRSLSNHRSIAVRFQNNTIRKVLQNPRNAYLSKPSISDLYYMEQPQEYLNPEYISDDNKPESDIENNIIQPITFDNPKVKVGRKDKKN